MDNKKYSCKSCVYNTNSKQSYTRHLTSNKHINKQIIDKLNSGKCGLRDLARVLEKLNYGKIYLLIYINILYTIILLLLS